MIDEVVVSSDCDNMLKTAKQLGVTVVKREEYYCSNQVPMNEVYEHLAKNIDCKHVVYLHVTSPLLTDKSLKKAIEQYLASEDNFDCLATVEELQKYLWHDGKPVNYNPSRHPRSQDLPVYHALNFAVNIITRKKMIDKKSIVYGKINAFALDEIESIDVDNEIDFRIAEYFYSERIKNNA